MLERFKMGGINVDGKRRIDQGIFTIMMNYELFKITEHMFGTGQKTFSTLR
jgi:hypothetical protein